MGKKRKFLTVEDMLSKPWCYYCERAFDDLKILIAHQKAKHYKCDRCGRRLNTAGGLSVHLNQVHKEQLTKVDNALPEREGITVEIFGMEGIPDDVKQRHEKRVAEQYFEEQSNKRMASGNPPAGSKEALEPRKSKFGEEDDLIERFKEHMVRIESGEGPLLTAMDGVQPTPTSAIPPSASPAQAQGFQPPFQQPPMGFPPGQQPFPGQPPFQQPPFAGSPPFAQGPYQAPGGQPGSNLPSRPAFPGAPAAPNGAIASAVDDLISSAQAAAAPTPPAPAKAAAAKPDKNAKSRLVYSDNEVSPEEKMAMHPRYAVASKAA